MPHIRAAMSAALAVLGSIACLLVSGLLLALAYLARVEKRHEDAVGIKTSDRPTHEGKSGDIHLVLGFADEGALDALFVRAVETVEPATTRTVLESLAAKIGVATHGHAEFGVFRRIAVRPVDGVALVYVHARTRKPVGTFVDLGSRDRHEKTLKALVELAPDSIVELDVGRADVSSDPALGRPVALH